MDIEDDIAKMPSAWDPKGNELGIYKIWQERELFKPKDSGEPFSIIMPPPNANGDLHIGHGLGHTIEDLMIRYHRMKGDATLWLPGADHAGFETQIVFEKRLEKEGRSRFDFNRQQFYDAVFDFTLSSKSKMEGEARRLGASCDWSRNMFTLDPRIIKIVYKTFKRLFDEKLVYRGERLVNFCVKHGTAFSDLEVDHEERESSLWYIKYPFKDAAGYVTVATTRPETMLGDTAVAVNPKDKRYQKFIGQTVLLPLTGREIKIISDEFVDPAFGTGAVKVTPAHDPNDYEIANRHKLPLIKIINTRGRITDQAPKKYQNQKVKEAREAVVADLNSQGLLEKVVPYTHTVGVCYKCRSIIEPLLIPQWFVRVAELKKPALLAISTGEIKFVPERFKKVALTWLENFHDWNISRQIWWGIPIPAFFCPDHPDFWVVTETGEEPKESCPNCGQKLVRDPDTFDTWFSSGQWPYATLQALGGGEFERFYPTSVMETMYDIMPFWVCRMIMMGLYTTGKVPFKTVYIHGMVKDSQGRKMSKSKGNVINPIDLIEKFGADALRMAYIIGNPPGADMALSEDKVRSYRNFANKIWNASRFVLMSLSKTHDGVRTLKLSPKTPAQKEILLKLTETRKQVNRYLQSYRFHLAGEVLYDFFWHAFCDRFLEESKQELKDNSIKYTAEAVLLKVLVESLVMLHPFMPFVTEAVWQKARNFDSELQENLITSSWERN